MPSPCVAALGPASTRVLIHEVALAKKLAEGRRARSGDHAGLEAEEHRAGHVISARVLVLKIVDAAEMRVVFAVVPCSSHTTSQNYVQVKLILSPKQRAKPAASRTRTCTNAAVCIASGECPSRF